MRYSAINIDPEIMGGTAVFSGTRIPIQTLFDYFEGGDTIKEFLDDYPTVSKDQIVDILQMAKKTLIKEDILNKIFIDKNLPSL